MLFKALHREVPSSEVERGRSWLCPSSKRPAYFARSSLAGGLEDPEVMMFCFVLRGGDNAYDDVGDADVAGNVSVVVDCQPDPCPSGCRGSGGTCWTPPLGATRSQAPPVKI